MHSLGLVVGQSTPPLSQSVSHTPPALNDGHHATQVTIQVALVHRRRFHLSPLRSFFPGGPLIGGEGGPFSGRSPHFFVGVRGRETADVAPSMTGRRPKTSDKGATFWSVLRALGRRAGERASGRSPSSPTGCLADSCLLVLPCSNH